MFTVLFSRGGEKNANNITADTQALKAALLGLCAVFSEAEISNSAL